MPRITDEAAQYLALLARVDWEHLEARVPWLHGVRAAPRSNDDLLDEIDHNVHGRQDTRQQRINCAACIANVFARRTITPSVLQLVQTRLLGERAPWREATAYCASDGIVRAHDGRFAGAHTMKHLLVHWSDSRRPAATRATRAYLDMIYLHPFVDGNARAARIWHAAILSAAGLKRPPMLPLVKFSKRDPNERTLLTMLSLTAEGAR